MAKSHDCLQHRSQVWRMGRMASGASQPGQLVARVACGQKLSTVLQIWLPETACFHHLQTCRSHIQQL